MRTEVNDFVKTMINYVKRKNLAPPVMVTYTTLLPNTLRGQFLLRRAWADFVELQKNHPAYKHNPFPVVVYNQEFSKNKVHLHALFDAVIPLRSHQRCWNTIIHDQAGMAYVTRGADWDVYIHYIFKSKDRIDKFMGHYAYLLSEDLYITKLK